MGGSFLLASRECCGSKARVVLWGGRECSHSLFVWEICNNMPMSATVETRIREVFIIYLLHISNSITSNQPPSLREVQAYV